VVRETPEISTQRQSVNRSKWRNGQNDQSKPVPSQPAAQVHGKAPDRPEEQVAEAPPYYKKKGASRRSRSLCCKSLRFLIASSAGFVAVGSLIWATLSQPQHAFAFILPATLGSLSVWALMLDRECDMVAARTSALQDQHHLVHEDCKELVIDKALQCSQDSVDGKDAEVGLPSPESMAPSADAPLQNLETSRECLGHHLSAVALQPTTGTEGGGLADHLLVAALVSEYLRSARELRDYEERYGQVEELPMLHGEPFCDEGVEPPHATVVPRACVSDDLLCNFRPAAEPLTMVEPASRAPQACLSNDLQSKLSPAVEPLKTFKPASRAQQACASDASRARQVVRGRSPATAASFSRAAVLAERAYAMDTEAPMVSLSRGRI